MANGSTHRIAAAVVIGGIFAYEEKQKGETTLKPFAGATIAAATTNLPDVLEPAIHPHHRQFCHSAVFAAAVGYGVYRAYKWEPESTGEELLRFLALAGIAYLTHLTLDACTARSIPLLGKL